MCSSYDVLVFSGKLLIKTSILIITIPLNEDFLQVVFPSLVFRDFQGVHSCASERNTDG